MAIRTQSAQEAFGDKFSKAAPFHSPQFRDKSEAEAAPLETKLEIGKSQAEQKLNNLERAWFDVLQGRGLDWLEIAPWGMKLASHKCYYHPDFISLAAGQLTAWEVKGPQFWDDAKVKLKVAAKEYPFIRFVLVTRDKTGWTESEVKP